ncbi:hypothetical protein [Ekhidna sp.]
MEGLQNKNPLRNPEYIIAFGVALISICALFVSIRQTTIMSEQRALMHEQAKASVCLGLDWELVNLTALKTKV